jgi:predicted site-specific integrase-resolvase
MLIGYARVSKSDGSQVLDLQIDALIKAGVQKENIYSDKAARAKEDRVGSVVVELILSLYGNKLKTFTINLFVMLK